MGRQFDKMGLGGGKRDWKDTPAPAGPGGTLPKAGRTRAAPTQLSGTTGVTEDVASIALLGGSVAGTAEIPDTVQVPVTETPILEMLSDAEIMLRVAAGDDIAFDYLVEKFRRPMISFMYRMTRSQAVAEELAQEV